MIITQVTDTSFATADVPALAAKLQAIGWRLEHSRDLRVHSRWWTGQGLIVIYVSGSVIIQGSGQGRDQAIRDLRSMCRAAATATQGRLF